MESNEQRGFSLILNMDQNGAFTLDIEGELNPTLGDVFLALELAKLHALEQLMQSQQNAAALEDFEDQLENLEVLEEE